jgi:phospholipase/carboxylesterase
MSEAREAFGYVHLHRPPTDPSEERTLLLLHGTGGTEHDLLDIGSAVLPGARQLSLRGNVLEGSMARFFRRLAEGVFDEADVIRRAGELAAFVTAASAEYGFSPAGVHALGFSNGANIAAAMLLLHPQVLAGGILLRSMVPLVPAATPALAHARVLMLQGRHDPIIPLEQGERLAGLLRAAGAAVTVEVQEAGHGIVPRDVAVARGWMAGRGAGLEGHR